MRVLLVVVDHGQEEARSHFVVIMIWLVRMPQGTAADFDGFILEACQLPCMDRQIKTLEEEQ